MKVAVTQCGGGGPLESLVVMLGAAGYECRPVGEELALYLRRKLSCDTVFTVAKSMSREGMEPPEGVGPEATVKDLDTCDLYVDCKAHRNGPRVWARHPHLARRTLWYRITGGKPEAHPPRGGDEVSPPCPVLTPNQWYRGKELAYTCWLPFRRSGSYCRGPRPTDGYGPAVCLVHNLTGWGYGTWAPGVKALGVKVHGQGSPDGLLAHREVPGLLARALAMVHLKSCDAPGYSMYESLAAACPLVVSELMILRNRMEDLLVPGVTCLTYTEQNGTHGITQSMRRIAECLDMLRDPAINARIGEAGRQCLRGLMWTVERNGEQFSKWLEEHFGGAA